MLPLKLSYSNKEVKNSKVDSIYFKTIITYKLQDNSWDSLEVGIRKRGYSRLRNCYFAPIRMKFKKEDIKNTIFEDNKKLKLVLPCLKESDNNDNVVKEFIAYKIYEIISPYYFKTRLVDIDYEENKGSKTKPFNLKGILKEDDKDVAKRFDGKIFERESVSPYALDSLTSVRNSFFNYLIGNTDFSQSHLHNVKLIYIDKSIVPICYDFDMSGLVNASYAAVSETVNIESVTDRTYRGVKRNQLLYNQVRNEFLGHKSQILKSINDTEKYFESSKEFSSLKTFVLEFFDVLNNDAMFKQRIIDQARG
ncbi:hypothetical protein FVF61_08485 [Formosa maritima]|uniref:HipA-like C-terminal domain-containing protein n=1 Tax=Formosa maritima TaxID=2592046 RepID=A0A5D0G745_9FLAO|nr:hypothetical protein FVF61_08485 [Formosa maritima]